jgi:ABC-type glycerol-3-phosphate transport system permease component
MTTNLQPATRPAPPHAPAAPRTAPPPVRPSRLLRRSLRAVTIAIASVLIGVFSVFPFFWMGLTSIKDRSEIITPTPVFVPDEFDFSRYGQLMAEGFGRYAFNSLRLAVLTTLLCLACSALAAYSLARFRIPLRRYLVLVILAAQMFPLVVLLIPLFILLRNLELLNTLPGLVLAHLAFTVPLTVAVLRGFFASIPEQLDEAAMIDGATRVGALFRVVLPVAAPGIAATSIFGFISTWNEFIFALTFTPGTETRVLPVALALLIGRDTAEWGSVMTGSTIYTVPIVLFFLVIHRQLMRGMALGAVKG